MSISDIPAVNAALNSLSTVLLLAGFIFIKSGNREAHRKCMVAAFGTSAVFLIGYVTHKILVRGVHTPFGGEGFIQTVYYVMLITHVVLAMAIVPLVLLTIARARRGDFAAHKRIARWTWPIWMYVSVTGVLVYFFLYRWWPSA
jgi:putative membrane protein